VRPYKAQEAAPHIAFISRDFSDATGVFGGDIDLVRFQPTVAPNDAGRQLRFGLLPPVVGPTTRG